MTNESKSVIRCAIYTRKSSEEGLEQSFNSLDAQREACAAFIASQRHEGWRALPALYDDGGYSGGNLERPGLKRLLEDIEANKVDTIVVYKVDRLTRSLADFAKIVEALDARGVSFVSVTQQFNTTTSMGRLTLNILLSFAQFEREVTGERIRDKIAASKRKGMWMGGTVPLGYDVKERKLVVNPEDAKLVVRLFHLYLELGCVSKLKARLDQEGITSKARTSAAGNRSGGTSYYRGALYQILKNRIYLGEIPHRGQNHPGEHSAIVPRELWDQVEAQLRSDHQGRRNGLKANSPSLLVGLLQDAEGNRFTPCHTTKNGRRYRYYVCPATSGGKEAANKPSRVPAHDVERRVALRLQSFLQSGRAIMDELSFPEEPAARTQQIMAGAAKQFDKLGSGAPAAVQDFVRKVVQRVVVHADRIEVEVGKQKLRDTLTADLHTSSARLATRHLEQGSTDVIRLDIEARVKRCGGEMRLVFPPDHPGQAPSHPASSLLKAVARGRQWYEWIVAGEVSGRRSIAQRVGLNERYVGRVLECAFLAPDIVEAILDGRQPPDLTFKKLTHGLPLSWIEQRRELGFPSLHPRQ
ncbi:MAG TPA: recombinase family protein [Candidatus Sulfotelmatobacter sp.]